MTSTTSDIFTADMNGSTSLPAVTIPPEKQEQDFWIGLFLAVGSSGFIGVSFICQKLGLLSVAEKDGGVRAGDGGHKYLLEWKWWLGMLSMGIGETLNFVAYIFAPATLVTPLGALSVIASAVLASHFLQERLNLLGKVGCCLCLIGSTLVVLHSPKTSAIENMDELLEKVQQPAVLVLTGLIYAMAAFSIFFLAPRYGSTSVVVYVFICSTLGSLTVMGAKGLGVAITETFAGRNEFTNWLTYVMLAVTVFDIVLQINFLNKALDTFNTAVVTPTYYVMFTTSVVIFSAVLLQEFNSMTIENVIGDLCGFLTIVGGIFILNAFKDMDVSLRNLPKAKKQGDNANANADDEKGTYMRLPMHDHNSVFEYDETLSDEEAQAIIDPVLFRHVVKKCQSQGQGQKQDQVLRNGYTNPAFLSINDEKGSTRTAYYDNTSDNESTNM